MKRRGFIKSALTFLGVATVAPKVLIPQPEKIGNYTLKYYDSNNIRIFKFGWDEGWVREGDVCVSEDGDRFICMIDEDESVGEIRMLQALDSMDIIYEKESDLWFFVDNKVHLLDEAIKNPDVMAKIYSLYK